MKKCMLKINITVLLFVLATSFLLAQKSVYQKQVYINAHNDTLRYRMLKNQHGNEKVPLIIYLHGAGERARDNELQLEHIPAIFTDTAFMHKHAYCVIAPQCPPADYWVRVWPEHDGYSMLERPSFLLQMVAELMDSIIATNTIDETRIYVTGISIGGIGTWDLISHFPAKFAAAIPLCGIGDSSQAKNISRIPLWVFHGRLDNRISVRSSRIMVKALQEAGGNPRYTEYPFSFHSIWDKTYRKKEVWEWLFQQRLN